MFCPSCGAPASPANQRFCLGCGGDLHAPSTPPTDLTVLLEPTPRRPPSLLMLQHLPPKASFLLLFGTIFGSVGTLLGAVFAVVGFASELKLFVWVGLGALLLFGATGWGCVAVGIRQLLATRRVWRDGATARGEILESGWDRSVRVNGRSPVRLRYQYKDLHGTYQGQGRTWYLGALNLPRGSSVTLIVDPQDPTRSLLVLPPWR